MDFILGLLSTVPVFFIILCLKNYIFPGLTHRLPPGPKGWPIIGCIPLLGTLPHAALANLAKTFEPIMCLKLGTCDVLVVSNPDSARIFMKDLDNNFSNRPHTAGSTYMAYSAQDLVFTDMGPKWNLFRKLTSLHIIAAKPYTDWEPTRAKEIRHMVQDIYQLSLKGELVEVPSMLLCTIANIVGQKSLSRRVFSLQGTEFDDFKHIIEEITKYVSFVHIGDFIPFMSWIDIQGVIGKMKHLHKKFDGLLMRMIEEHSSTHHEREKEPDFLDVLMQYKDATDGKELTMTNIKGLILNLFVAGVDTTSRTIEWALTEMIINPKILARAQEEIDRVVGKSRHLKESDLPNLPYLKAICKETFRLHPPLPLSVPRICTKACEANGYYIPKNSMLMVNIWAIGRDSNVWPEPLVFNPERFLGGERAKIEPLGNDFELLPFGGGRRICAGIRMGQSIVEYTLGMFVHSFEWRVPGGARLDVNQMLGSVLHKTVPLSAMAVPRLEPSAYIQY